MCKNIVERGRPQMTRWRMRIACWVTKATNTHSQNVILITFPPQQWLHESASVWRYTYIASLVCGCSHSLPAATVPGFRISYSSRSSPSFSSTTFQDFPGYCDLLSEVSKFYLQMYHFTSIFLKLKSTFLMKNVFFLLLKTAFDMEILDLISVYNLQHLLSGHAHSCNVPLSPTLFVLYRETIVVCSENHTKHINALCGQNVELTFVITSGT